MPVSYRHQHRHLSLLCVSLLFLAGAAGCNVAGVVASKLPPPTVKPAYEGLANESTAIIVWAAPEVEVDHPGLTVQIGKRIENNLKAARDSGGRGAQKTLENLSFPYPTESYARYLKEDPTLSIMPARELAALAGARRVIYVEIDRFTTRGGAAQGLVRGVAEVNLAVYEIDDPITATDDVSLANRTPTGPTTSPAAREAYREAAIRVTFPERGPEEGSNTLSPQRAYAGLVAGIADTIAKRFVPHSAEE